MDQLLNPLSDFTELRMVLADKQPQEHGKYSILSVLYLVLALSPSYYSCFFFSFRALILLEKNLPGYYICLVIV